MPWDNTEPLCALVPAPFNPRCPVDKKARACSCSLLSFSGCYFFVSVKCTLSGSQGEPLLGLEKWTLLGWEQTDTRA